MPSERLPIVRADSPAKRMEDLIVLARASPGKLNYASGGVRSPPHLAGAAFEAVNRIRVLHVPYKGPSDIPLALLRGDADSAFTSSIGAVPLVKSGKMRALAVTTATRNRELPEVPTLAEVLENDLLVVLGFIKALRQSPASASQRQEVFAPASR